jgi:hypothetical protein
VAGAAKACGCVGYKSQLHLRHNTAMQSATLLIPYLNCIACVNGCVLRQFCTTELVWLAAAGSGVQNGTLEKMREPQPCGMTTAMTSFLWMLQGRAFLAPL